MKQDHSEKLKKIESLEFTLPELSIDRNRKIENFYPYFLKANLLELNVNNQLPKVQASLNPLNTFLEYKNLKNSDQSVVIQCLDPVCEVCDGQNTMICLQCLPGHFLLEGKCYNACPESFMADIYRRECIPLNLRQKSKIILKKTLFPELLT